MFQGGQKLDIYYVTKYLLRLWLCPQVTCSFADFSLTLSLSLSLSLSFSPAGSCCIQFRSKFTYIAYTYSLGPQRTGPLNRGGGQTEGLPD